MPRIPIMIAGQPQPHAGHFGPGELDYLRGLGIDIWNNDSHLSTGLTPTREWCERAELGKTIVPIQPENPYSWRGVKHTIETLKMALGEALKNCYYFPTPFDEAATNVPADLKAELETAKSKPGLPYRILDAEEAIRDWRIANYAKAKEHYRSMKPFLPIKYIVAMPFPVPDIAPEDWITPDVGAWPLSLIEKNFDKLGHLMDRCPEKMAYLTDADFPMTVEQALQVGPRMRALDIEDGLVFSDLSILFEHLFDPERRRPTPVLMAIIKGCGWG